MITFKQYYTPKPVPPEAQKVLDELNELLRMHKVPEYRIHASYDEAVQQWGIGSNYEEGWDSLVYTHEGKWVWREPWEGTDRPTDTNDPAALAKQLVQQFLDI